MNMKLAAAAMVLAGCVLLAPRALFAQDPAPGGGEAAPKTLKIGFADIKKIIDKYERTKTLEADIDRFRIAKSDEIKEKQAKLKEVQDDLKVLNPGSRMYFEKMKQARRMQMEIEYAEDELKVDLQQQLLKATKDIYADITRQIQTYAEKNGFHVIFKVETGDIESESKAELILKINSRGVLYYDPALEVTDALIRIMNEEYTGKIADGGEKKEGEGEGEAKEGDGGAEKPAEEGAGGNTPPEKE